MARDGKQSSKRKKAKSVPLIIPAGGGGTAAPQSRHRKADEGGIEEGMFSAVSGYFTTARKPIDNLDKQMASVVAYVQKAIDAIEASPVGALELSGVEVGLAVSVEGTIGIATAGVETSLTLSFTRPSPKKT